MKSETIKDQEQSFDYMNQVLTLMNRFSESDMTKLQVEVEGFKVLLERVGKEIVSYQVPVQAPVVDQVPVTKVAATDEKMVETILIGTEVKAPLVGTFYSSNEPGGKPFIEKGDHVKKGQPLCIIEAMKIMNEIESPCDGIVREIRVQNEEAVGFDQVLMVIE